MMSYIGNKNTNGIRTRALAEREMMQELTPGAEDYGKVVVGTDGTYEGEVMLAKNTDLVATMDSQAKGISGFIDRDLDLEISETNAVVGVKNRYAKFGNEIVDLYGPELVTNGDFSDGTTGWVSLSGATLSNENSNLIITPDGVLTFPQAQQTISGLTVGGMYAVTFEIVEPGWGIVVLSAKNLLNGDYYYPKTAGVYTAQFIATYNSHHLRLVSNSATVHASFGNISVREIKSIDLAPTVPDVQTIGSTPLAVTGATITGTNVAVDAVVGTDAAIPAHNNGHQTKITANVTATSNGMEVQILDKSNSNAVIRTQTLDSHESKKTLEFWVPANVDGYQVHCIKRTNVGSGDESIVVSAKGFEDLVTTDVVSKSDYAVIDKEELVVNGTFDNTANINSESGGAYISTGYELKIDTTAQYSGANQIVGGFVVGKKYIVSIDGYLGSAPGSGLQCAEFAIDINFSSTAKTTKKVVFIATNTYTTFIYRTNNSTGTAYFDNHSVTPVDDIFRAIEDIPLGTSVYDSRFQKRDYVSNQNLVTLKQDVNGTVTTHTETLFEDATEIDCNLDRDNVMLKNGFSMSGDGLFHKQNDKHIVVGLWQG